MPDIAPHPLLEQLAGIQQPLTVSWWPPAPVWWSVFILLFLLGIISRYLWQRNKRLRCAALAELTQITRSYHCNITAKSTPVNNPDDPGTDCKSRVYSQLAMDISILLRRVALSRYPATDVAGLSGDEWLCFLDTQGNTNAFTRGCGAILGTAPYQSEAGFNADELLGLARQWIKQNT